MSLNIFAAWRITLPAAGLVGALCARLAVALYGAI
jgi:hypothetical protein